jgi:hypothetical protein
MAAAVGLMAALVALAPPGPSASAAADPVVSVSPEAPRPGDAVTVSVTGCTAEPSATVVADGDDVALSPQFTEGPPGTWTASLTAPGADLSGYLGCAGGEASFEVDVEAPYLRFGPFLAPGGYVEPLETLDGTDCPAGTSASISFDGAGQHWSATAPTDPGGDWSVALPSFAALPVGTPVTASASCGALTYRPIRWSFGEATEATTTLAPPPSVEPPAAAPVAAPATYTG